MVAIIPLIFSPGINERESKSIRFSAGAAAFSLAVDGPGAPVGVESCHVGAALPPADAWEDGTEDPVSVVTTEFGVPSSASPPPPFSASFRIVYYAIR